jgi:hypothetical protein
MTDPTSSDCEGGCACGAIRYRLTTAPMFVHCCHCTSCQTETGSAFALNAMIEGDRVELVAGAPEAVMTPSESGKGQEIMRCPQCHVALWSHYGSARRRIAFVRIGTLDAPGACPPDVHIFTRSKLPWVVLPEGAAAFEEYYRPKEAWPVEAQARYKAVMA